MKSRSAGPRNERPLSLRDVVTKLEALHGIQEPPPAKTAFELVLWEVAAYLVDDVRRARVFEDLRKEIGLEPESILRAGVARISRVISAGGMHPEQRAGKVETSAALALTKGLDHAVEQAEPDLRSAIRLLREFPGIGEPGAEKILLLLGKMVTLAPESNGVRVLTRLGFGREERSYPATYRSAAAAVAPELPSIARRLVRAHLVLRCHGQNICRRAAPECSLCPLATGCLYAGGFRGRASPS